MNKRNSLRTLYHHITNLVSFFLHPFNNVSLVLCKKKRKTENYCLQGRKEKSMLAICTTSSTKNILTIVGDKAGISRRTWGGSSDALIVVEVDSGFFSSETSWCVDFFSSTPASPPAEAGTFWMSLSSSTLLRPTNRTYINEIFKIQTSIESQK